MKLYWVKKENQIDLDAPEEQVIDDAKFKNLIQQAPIVVNNLDGQYNYAISQYKACLGKLQTVKEQTQKQIFKAKIERDIKVQKDINENRSYVIEGIEKVKNMCDKSMYKTNEAHTKVNERLVIANASSSKMAELCAKKAKLVEKIERLNKAKAMNDFKKVEDLLRVKTKIKECCLECHSFEWEGKEMSTKVISQVTENDLKRALYTPIVKRCKSCRVHPDTKFPEDSTTPTKIKCKENGSPFSDFKVPLLHETVCSSCYFVNIDSKDKKPYLYIGHTCSLHISNAKRREIKAVVPAHFGICEFKGYIIVSGGEENGKSLQNVLKINPYDSNEMLEPLTEVPMVVAKSEHTMVSCNKYMFTLGGCTIENGKTLLLNTFEKFDGASWKKECNLSRGRKGIAAVIHNYIIYAFGGEGNSKVIETYNIHTANEWKCFSVLHEAINVSYAGIVSLNSTNLIIFGGKRGKSKSNLVYKLSTDSWGITQLNKMTKEDEFPAILPSIANNMLYARSESNNGFHSYDMLKDEWKFSQCLN